MFYEKKNKLFFIYFTEKILREVFYFYFDNKKLLNL
nr:MAG TPA: hypothetical protein [Caudoviricetes sp.]